MNTSGIPISPRDQSAMAGTEVSATESWLSYTSILLAASSAGWTACTFLILGKAIDPIVLSLMAAMTLLLYNRDRLKEMHDVADQMNSGARVRWLTAHQRAFRSAFWVVAATAVGLVCLRPRVLVPLILGTVLGVLYNARVLPGKRTFRQVSGVKVPWVAITWVVGVVGIPLALHGGPWDARIAWYVLSITCLIAGMVNVCDVRDIAGDRLAGTPTLPALLGFRWGIAASVALAVAGTLAAYPGGGLGFCIAGGYIVALAILYRPQRDRVMRLLIDGTGVVAATLMLVTS